MNKQKRSQINFGIILVGLGILFLLNTIGIVSGFNWHLLLRYWPIILIFIGLNIILKRSIIWWLVPVLFIFCLIGLFIISDSPGYYHYEYEYDFDPPSLFNRDKGIYRSDMKITEEINEMEANINFSAGKLVIDSVRDVENLYEARLRYNYGRPSFDFKSGREEGKGYLTIKQPGNKANWVNISNPNDWKLYLTPEIPIDIKLNAGAGDFKFNIEELKIRQLIINSGAGNLEADINNYMRYLKINSAATKIELNLPEGMDVKIKAEGLISKNNFSEEGLTRIEDNIYQTSNYDNTDEKLNVEINSPASKIEIDFYRKD